MRRLTANDATQSHHACEPARLRESHRRERQLEGTRNRHDRDRLAPHAGLVELPQRRLEQLVRDLAVEPRGDDGDATPCPVGLPFNDVDVVRDVELAVGVLLRLVGQLFGLVRLFALLAKVARLLEAFDVLARPGLAHSLPSSGSYFRS